ncbi:unnamed protein product [Moneuplotes crassus]|uniref:Uncharacterized protein n=1 Tax=Euplotes crassus TaxID=5936 RepID=A0AAD2D2A1_EUPCR|nr:unnamed protein product [Moneuplotes crassus]
MDYYYSDDQSNDADSLIMAPKINVDYNFHEKESFPSVRKSVDFSNEYIVQNIVDSPKKMPKKQKVSLSLSTATLPAKLLYRRFSPSIINKCYNNPKSVKSSKKFTQKSLSSGRGPSFKDYKLPKTIVKFNFSISTTTKSCGRKSHFEEFAKKKTQVFTPSKLNIHQAWELLKSKKGIPGAKRSTLIDEIIKRSKEITTPVRYGMKHRIKVNGVSQNKAPKHGYFDDKLTNAYKTPGVRSRYDSDKYRRNFSSLAQFGRLSRKIKTLKNIETFQRKDIR